MNHASHDEHPPTPLTRSEIRGLLPSLQRVTKRASLSVTRRLDRLDDFGVDVDLDAIDEQVQRWFGEVRSLGAVPRGLWLVEFPSLAGWFGWRDGDDDVTLFRLYGTGPDERSLLH